MKKKIRNNLTVLERQLNEAYETHGVVVPKEAYPYIREAMKSFAVQAIHEERAKKRDEMLWVLKHFPKPFILAYWKFMILWLRKRFFLISKANAQLRADTENYKIYVVRNSMLTYKLISTLDFKYNKKIKVLKRNLTAKEMESKAAFIAYHKNDNHGR